MVNGSSNEGHCMGLGLEGGTVRLVPYNPEWVLFFEEEKVRLLASVGPFVLEIQHVGSTSISGMTAKPILDIAIAIKNYEEARVCIQPIVELGYEYKGELGIPRRHYFVKGEPRTHHIHMNEIGSQDWIDQIEFRDYLTRHPETAQEYVDLKLALAGRFPMDRQSYLEGKAPFIQKVLRMARAE